MPTLNEFAAAYVWNSLWQAVLLLVVAAASTRLLPTVRAAVTHRVWVSCFLLAVMLPALPMLLRVHADVHPGAVTTLVMQASRPLGPATPDAPTLSLDGLAPATAVPVPAVRVPRVWVALGVLRWLYFAGVLIALARLAAGVARTVRMQRRAKPADAGDDLQALWQACRAGFGAGHTRLLVSSEVLSPATMTLWNAVVVLPATHLDAQPEMAAAFCHELAHVRRGDFRKNLLYELLAVPLFFHPAVHAMRRRIQQTRELVCDDLAADFLEGRTAYAGSLIRLAETMSGVPATAAGRELGVFDGDVLEKRVMNMIEAKAKQAAWRIAVSAMCGGLLVAASCALGTRYGVRPVLAAALPRLVPSVKAPVAVAAARPIAPVAAPVTVAEAKPLNEPAPALVPALLMPQPEQQTPKKIEDSVVNHAQYPNPGDLKAMSFKLGQVRLQPGDTITIDELRGTSGGATENNVYQIKGHYTLGSHEDALLAASVTTSTRDAHRGGSPSLNMSVARGSGQFTLWLFQNENGDPHLSFYPTGGGESFASVYFVPGAAKAGLAAAGDAPKGWSLAGDSPERYSTGIDPRVMHDGAKSAFLASTTDAEFEGFGTLSQYFAGSAYMGRRVRLRAWVKSDQVAGWAGLWMRVDTGKGSEQKSAAFDNMQGRAIKGTTDWRPYDVVLDVPQNATGIGMGVLLTGHGKVWMSGVKLEVVPRTVAVTDLMAQGAATVPSGPTNLALDR